MVQLMGGDAPIEKKVARGYQTELLEICQQRNAIVRMDTGLGKTFIAIMLMRWLAALPKESNIHKIMVFLVPKVALVDQQSEALVANTSLRVRPYRGDMGVEFWDRERWISEFEDTDCVVMTAEIWRSVLNHAYWTLDRVSLMVFDECHHTSKRHPYNMIMQRYHHDKAEGKPLPHILGLTASAIYNPDNPEKSFDELQTNLDSVIINVRDQKVEVEGYTQKPLERPLYYSSEALLQPPTDFEIMLDELEIWEYVNQEKIENRIDNVKSTLGSLACDVYIMNWLHSLQDPLATSSSLQSIRRSGRMSDVEALYKKMKAEIDRKKYYGLGDVSEKMRVLVQLLSTYRGRPGFSAIIFTEQRHHALALATILGKSQTLQSFIRPTYLVGHGSSGVERLASEGMAARVQRRTIDLFRSGDINLLVATSVAEEGLDFQACNLIVRFDVMATYIGYIQSRGRARKKDSEFVVMVRQGSPEEHRWRQYVAAEPQLHTMYSELDPYADPYETELENTPRYIVPSTGAVLSYDSAVALLSETCSLIPTDAYSPPSKPRYELDELGRSLFSTTIFLPMMPLLPPEARVVKGPEISTKKGSKQAAAFECCKMFHALGILDDYLLPQREGKGDLARDADDALVDRTVLPLQLQTEVKNVFGNMWADDSRPVYLNRVSYKDRQGEEHQIGLVCAEGIDLRGPLKMHEPGVCYDVTVELVRKFAWAGAERYSKLASLDKFTRWVITQVINRKLIQGPMVYLVAPLTPSVGLAATDIDWETLHRLFADITSLDEISAGTPVIAPWQFMRKHIFTVHAIRKDLNPRNTPRVTGLTKRGRIYDRTDSFGAALIALLDYEGVDAASLDFGETILHLQPWFKVRNNLRPMKASKAADVADSSDPSASDQASGHDPLPFEDDPVAPLQPWETPDWKWRQYKLSQYELDVEHLEAADPDFRIDPVTPLPDGVTTSVEAPMVNGFLLPWSFCKRSAMSMGVWNAFSWLPSLVRAIQDRALTQHAMQTLSLPPLQDTLVTQALTLPMCCTGSDYQTLETIGDSALKLAVTVVVYNRYTSKDEGGLSTRRMNSIDNQHLRMKAVKKELHRFLLTDFFRVHTWVPSTLENGTMSSDGRHIHKTIPRRALSDCVESLLGAAYLSGGFPAVLQTGSALGLCFGGSQPWEERYVLPQDVREMPVGRGLLPLEEQLGYKFKHGQLLLQAVTHRSFAKATTHCQEREEFLGDAVLDNFVIDRLSRKFPTATPSHLTRLRSTLVSNSALGYLAVKVMGLHRYLLHSTPLLNDHFARALKEAEAYIQDDFVNDIWLFDPPKPAADALEGIIGAIFIDCGWRVEPVFAVLDRVFEKMFELLPHKEAAPRDPASRLRLYLQHRQCRSCDIIVSPRPDIQLPAVVTVMWHEQTLSKVSHHSQASAKQLASKIALGTLIEHGEQLMQLHCTCQDNLAEHMGDIKEWKKDVETSLLASKDILPGRLLPGPQSGGHLGFALELESAIEADLADNEAKIKEDKELELKRTMEETFGYNPDMPVPEDEIEIDSDEARQLPSPTLHRGEQTLMDQEGSAMSEDEGEDDCLMITKDGRIAFSAENCWDS